MTRVLLCCIVLAAGSLVAAAPGPGRPGLVAADQQVYVVPASGGAVRQLTSDDLPAHSPSWSPDGKRLAYVQGSHISVLDRAKSSSKRIVFATLLGPDPPAWAPDGNRIAFTGLSSPEGFATIGVVASTGSKARTLASTPWGTGDSERGPVWSPDGKLLAFCLQGPAKTVPGGVRASGDLDLAVAALNGSRRRLTAAKGNEFDPLWSPGGRSVLYATDSGLRLLPAAGGPSRLVVRLASSWGAAWAPDGGTIAFAGIRPGESGTHLYVVRPSGTGLRRLGGEVVPARPAWSPNGRLIAFGTGAGAIRTVRPDGTGGKTVATLPDMDIGHLAWSPDGTTIAFDARKQQAES